MMNSPSHRSSDFHPDEPMAANHSLTHLLERNVHKVAAFLVLLVSGLLALCLMTWSIHDPSLTHAIDRTPINALGYPGAAISDLFMQVFGLAAMVILLPLLMFSWRLYAKAETPSVRDYLHSVVFIVAATFFAACLPVLQGWPLPTSLGGLFGDALYEFSASLVMGMLGSFTPTVLGFIALIIAISQVRDLMVSEPSSMFDSRNTPQESEDNNFDHYPLGAITLGAIGHLYMRFKSYFVKSPQTYYAFPSDHAHTWQKNPSFDASKGYRGGLQGWQQAFDDYAMADYAPAPLRTKPEAFNDMPPPWQEEPTVRQEPSFTMPPPVNSQSFVHDPVSSQAPVQNQTPLSSIGAANHQPEPVRPTLHANAYDQQSYPYSTESMAMPGNHQTTATAEPLRERYEHFDTLRLNQPVYETPSHREQAAVASFDNPVREYATPDVTVYGSEYDKATSEPVMPLNSDPMGSLGDRDEISAPLGYDHFEAAAFSQQAPDDGDVSFVSETPARKSQSVSTRRKLAASTESEVFNLPPLDILQFPQDMSAFRLGPEELKVNATELEQVLGDFGVKGDIIKAKPGPVVTLYELEPAPGIKSSRVIGLADDIARSMSAVSARVAVVPGRNVIGIELPNAKRETVVLREMIDGSIYKETPANLPVCLGKTIGGEPVVADLAKMPHLLIAGTTGSGKSVAINTMILSLLYKLTPEQCRLIMIDPKMLELSIYDDIPHLLTPVVTDPKKAVLALKWTVREMEERYRKMSKLGVRNIEGYNRRVKESIKQGKAVVRTVQTGFNQATGEAVFERQEMKLEPLPFIVVIVDEMADLMMVAGKEIEGAVQRLAQMARAAGIHIVMATQRPSVDVITGTIKANFPTRISFQVTSRIDSRTILGDHGAEQLLGQGDMLYMAGGGRTVRLHGPFVKDEEVEEIVTHLKAQGAPDYLTTVTDESLDEADQDKQGTNPVSESLDGGDLYDQAVAVVLRDKKASTSYIQRRLSIGYNRAASLIERMEKEGVVSTANHAGKREILVENAEA